MNPIQVNLLRDVCLGPRQRRWCYHGIMIYLLAWSGMLIWTVSYATRWLCRSYEMENQTLEQMNHFKQLNGVVGDIDEENEELQLQLNQMSQHAQRIAVLANNRLDLPRIFAKILEPLPEEAFLLSVRIEARQRRFQLELAIPDTEKLAELEPRSLVSKWQEDPYLSERFKRVEQLDSRRYEMGDGPLRVFAYSCVLNVWDK